MRFSVRTVLLMMRVRLSLLGRKGFVGSVGVLVGGTAFAQGLTVLMLPVITRLYTPSDFSVLAVFASMLALISAIACLRLEIAIPLPEDDTEAASLLVLSLFSCTAIALITAVIVWVFSVQIINLLVQPALSAYLWLLPIAVWLAGAYSATQFWATRKRRFSEIARTRMTQAVGGAGTQIGLGYGGFVPLGLLVGQVIISGAGLVGLGLNTIRTDRLALKSVTQEGLLEVLKKYDRFPKYSTFEALANSASIQLPVLVIAATAHGPDAGYLMLAMRAMALPMGLLGAAVSQVYLAQAPEELRAGRLSEFTSKILAGLAKIGIGPLILAGAIAPMLFPLVFGKEWLRAGELVAWMTPWFAMQFLASPVSMTLHVTGHQRWALNLQLLGLILRLGSVIATSWWMPSKIVEAYALSGFIFYFLYFFVIVQTSDMKVRDLLVIVTGSIRAIGFWIAAALGSILVIPLLSNLAA